MKRTLYSIMTGAILFFAVNGNALVRFVNETGVGARAFGLAGNAVTTATDLSSVYWNPALLAFMPVREFQISADGIGTVSEASLLGFETLDEMPRVRLTSLGLLSALPTSRGGFTIAGAFSNPLVFDDIANYEASYREDGRIDSVLNNFKTFGGLRLWGASAGVQIAQGLGVGVSLSLMTGRERTRHIFYKETDGVIDPESAYDHDYDEKIDTRYIGYDIRAGLLYTPTEWLRIGVRFEVPQVAGFSEHHEVHFPHTTENFDEYDRTGRLVSSMRLAAGAGFMLPFMTVSTEVRGRAPYTLLYPAEKIEHTQAAHATMGGGAGVEIPVMFAPAVIRAGYSFDQVDLHRFITIYNDDYDGESIDWSDDGIDIQKQKQTFTGGVGIMTQSVGLEAAYGYSFYEVGIGSSLRQITHQHRFLLSVSVRY
jgi:hypothetical protein